MRIGRPTAKQLAPSTWTPPAKGEWTADAPNGKREDPVNLYVHGSLDQLKAAFAKEGWTEANPNTTANNIEYGAAVAGELGYKAVNAIARGVEDVFEHLHLGGKPKDLPDPFQNQIQRMPVSPGYFGGKLQVVAFEKDNHPIGGRHHFRVFDTGQVDANGQHVWAVSATRDTGVQFTLDHPQALFFSHKAEKNTDHERDTVLESLKSSGVVASSTERKLDFGGTNAIGLGPVDGGVYDVVLK